MCVNDVEVDDDQAEDGGEDEEGGESGERNVKKLNSPGKPSAEKVERHN